MNILEVRQLKKSYKAVKAVDGISFSIPQGICFGLLGPNGAGKTTTIEIIEGIIEPSDGEIIYQGKPRDSSFQKEAGIQFQQTALMDYLTVHDTLKLFASLYPQPLPLEKLIDTCDLGEFVDQVSTRLSGGQRQRLLLALALINDPKILFLDEPTTGLDPQSRRRFWSLIERVKAQGKTILLTTHYMDEAQQLCDELIIIDHGKIIDHGSPQSLLNKHFTHKQVIVNKAHLNGLGEKLNAKIVYNETEAIILTERVEATIQSLIDNSIDLTSLRIKDPTLEDLFLKLTGHSLRE